MLKAQRRLKRPHQLLAVHPIQCHLPLLTDIVSEVLKGWWVCLDVHKASSGAPQKVPVGTLPRGWTSWSSN